MALQHQEMEQKIDKCQFRDPKRPRRPMKAKKRDLKDLKDTDKIKDFRLRLCRLSDKEIAHHTKPKSLKKVPEKTPNQKPKQLFDIPLGF